MTQTATFKIIGISTDTSVCECCGKKNLKKVVVMENLETGSYMNYGTECARKALGRKKTDVEYEYEIRAKVALWLAHGHSKEAIITGLGNRGYGVGVKDGKVYCRGIVAPVLE